MSVETADALLDALRESGLLESAQLEELGRAWRGRESGPGGLVRYLLDKAWVTAFQAEQFAQGRADRLILGPYRLLDRLGQDELRAVALAKMEGYTNEEIARQQGCVVRTVERRLRTIRSLLQQEPAP